MSIAAASSTTTWDDCVGAATWLREPLQRILSYPNPLPVQQAVIPTITRALLSGLPNDVSLTAPTGSGKTLCYLLPLLRLLTETKKGVDDNALRCLILVPSPALGQQVHRELQRLTRPTSIRVACICAEVVPNASTQDADAAEAKALVRRVALPRSCLASARAGAVEKCGGATSSAEDGNSCPVSDADSDMAEDFMASEDEEGNDDDPVWTAGGSCPAQVRDRASTRVRYFSNADVVVATPQRLLHHLDHTRGLRLVDLRLFVIDEADQVLVGNFASQVQKVNARYEHEVEQQRRAQQRQQQRTSAALTASLAAAAAGTSTSASSLLRFPGLYDSSSGSPAFSCLHKVLCSATLSSRIARIAQVKLRNCSYYVLDSNGEERKEEALVSTAAATTTTTTKASVTAPTAMTLRTQFALPPTLQEHIIFVEDSYRPAVLLKLVHTLRERIATVQRQQRRQAEAENSQGAIAAASVSSPSAAVDGVNTDYPATEERAGTGVLIFCSTAEEARVMSHFLSAAGVTSVVEFTTLASEAERRRALLQRPAGADDNINSNNNTVSCVVASDALMRGIDIPNVGHVIMYHPPDAVSQYVHRAGRTARAMRPGHVHLLLSKTGPSGTQEDGEMALYRRLSQSLSRTLPVSYERYFFRFAEKPSRAAAADGATAVAEATASAVSAKAAVGATANVTGSAEWWVGQAEQFLVQSQHQLQRRWSSVLEAAAAVAAASARRPAAVAVVDGSSGTRAPAKGVSAAPGQASSSRKRLR